MDGADYSDMTARVLFHIGRTSFQQGECCVERVGSSGWLVGSRLRVALGGRTRVGCGGAVVARDGQRVQRAGRRGCSRAASGRLGSGGSGWGAWRAGKLQARRCSSWFQSAASGGRSRRRPGWAVICHIIWHENGLFLSNWMIPDKGTFSFNVTNPSAWVSRPVGFRTCVGGAARQSCLQLRARRAGSRARTPTLLLTPSFSFLQ